MLEKLFGSKTRVKVLKIFLLNPDKKFYLRQLSRDLKLQVNSIRRELVSLEEFGLLISSNNSTNSDILSTGLTSPKKKLVKEPSLNEKKYYWANKNFVLFPEVKSLISKAQIMAGESFIVNLRSVCDPKFILLSGMFVNSDNSPTDILVVADIDKEKLVQVINEMELELGHQVNFTIMDEAEFKYRQEIADVFLHSVLNSKKIILLDKILDKYE
jgi:hypothetical protein